MDLKELDSGVDPSKHWYYRSKALLLSDLADHSVDSVADVGAGSMYFSREIAHRSKAHTVWAIDSNYSEEHREKIGHAEIIALRAPTAATSTTSLWMFMDVIEHVEEPHEFLRQYVIPVASGTRFFVTVPAFQFMWSQHDEYLGHFRRYTKSSLVALLESVGLRVERVGYYYCSLFPLAWMQRKLFRVTHRKSENSSLMTKQSRMLNTIFYKIMKFEFTIFRGYSRLPGLTVVCTAIKR
jgi:hypothetical protein